MARILVVEHVAPETPGAIGDALARAGHVTETVRPFRGEPVPRSLGDAAALVVMGGPMGVYEADRHPHLRDEIALLEDAVARGVPVLGVCLGSQLLAAALGARVAPGPAKEIGWFPVELTDAAASDALFHGLGRRIEPLHWHGDRFELPRGAVALGSSARTPIQGFRHGEHVYGLLFHLEVTRAIVAGMVEAFADELHAERLDGAAIVAETERRLPALAPLAATVFERFAALVPAG
jgi:GMP synthase (glutamine-hydrolysing)